MVYSARLELVTSFALDDVPHLSIYPTVHTEQDAVIVQVAQTIDANPKTQEDLARLKDKTPEHFYHSLRVQIMFRCLIQKEPTVQQHFLSHTLDVAGALHDYGKTETPNQVLEKTRRHTPAERAIMQNHNEDGYNAPEIMALDQEHYPGLRELMIRHHDYPARDPGHPLLERAGVLLKIADQYDALCSKRDYKPSWEELAVRAELSRLFPHDRGVLEHLCMHFPGSLF